MKTKLVVPTLLAVTALAAVFAQGPLTPPGAPAPVMKTLDQIEPRTVINAANTPGDATSLFKITQPGSYYLAGNINGVAGKHGIVIAADGVTLDLNGFVLLGIFQSLAGVTTTSGFDRNIVVKNGTIRNWNGGGVDFTSHGAISCRLSDLTVSGNAGHGIRAWESTIVSNCTAFLNSPTGIEAQSACTIVNCTASSNLNHGITASNGCTLTNCASNNNTGTGIITGNACTVSACSAHGNFSSGIIAGDDGTLSHCTASGNIGIYGIKAGINSTLTNCTASNNSHSGTTSYGILTGDACTVDACTASGNTSTNAAHTGNTGMGIFASGGSTVKNCTASGNTGDGIQASFHSQITGNTCNFNGAFSGNGAGIHIMGDGNRIDSNNVTLNDRGLDVDGTANCIIRNTAQSNTANYAAIASGNTVGPVIGIQNPVTGTNPWANFSF